MKGTHTWKKMQTKKPKMARKALTDSLKTYSKYSTKPKNIIFFHLSDSSEDENNNSASSASLTTKANARKRKNL